MASPVPRPSSVGQWGANGHQQPPEFQQQHMQTQQQHHSQHPQHPHHHPSYQQPPQPHHPPQQPPQQPPQPQQGEDGPQLKLMGLKVSYTVDGDAQSNYLARYPQPLNVQTISIDQNSQIGIVDLKVCVQCVANCSPELLSHQGDYTVYAYDFSEPDTPLVGQGMLSRILDTDTSDSKFVVGRVTKNMLAALGGGLKETLEVRFRLLPTAGIQKPESSFTSNPHSDTCSNPNYRSELGRPKSQLSVDVPPPHSQRSESVTTPTGIAEWNTFLQSNPQLGHQGPAGHVAPQPIPRWQNRAEFPHPVQPRRDSLGHHSASSRIPPLPLAPARSSTATAIGDGNGAQSHTADCLTRIAPTPVDPSEIASDAAVNPPSRPSSRASTKSRRKAPTGRPRGRPRKNPAPEAPGSTSGYEDGTDADEGPPQKKRARLSKATKNINAPFGGGPDLLRVTASTSGSLRSLRPAGPPGEVSQGSHLQEVPRAPTPVPEGGAPMRGSFGIRDARSEIRRLSSLNQAATPAEQPAYCDAISPPSQDGRSPESDAMTPMYSDDSAALIGSSPPVPRSTPYIRSSPPPSSPILPPMPEPQAQPDSGFMSGGIDDATEEPLKPPQLEPAEVAPAPAPTPTPAPATTPAPVSAPPAPPAAPPAPAQAPASRRKRSRSRDTSHIPIQIFELRQSQGLSSDVEMVPYNGPGQSTSSSAPGYVRARPPGLERSLSANSRAPAPQRLPPAALPLPLPPPPSTQQENESPSLPKEPAVAGGLDVEMLDKDAPGSPGEQQSVQPPDHSGTVSHSNADAAVSSNARSVDPPTERVEKIEDQEDQELLQRLRMVVGEESARSEATTREKDSEPLSALPPGPLPASTSSSQPGAPSRLTTPSFRPLALPPIPASDPVGPLAPPPMRPQEATSFSEAICPPSDAPQPSMSPPPVQKASKNYVKKASIRQKLEEAIRNGEMPPYCNNCGAIETPTWRKVWTQEMTGVPEFCEFSEKPGRITAIIVLERDEEDKITRYQVVKKSLGPKEDKSEWTDSILCNPCGIWLAKWKCPRPATQWDKSQNRLQRSRHRRGGSNTGRKSRSRSKKAGSAGAPGPDAGSEANIQTDPAGPTDRQDHAAAHDDPGSQMGGQSFSGSQSFTQSERSGVSGSHSREASLALEKALLNGGGSQQPPSREHRSQPGSTHSRGSGTARSPINLDDADHNMPDMGTTRRLLFPSPRKDGVPKVLSDVAVNVTQTSEQHEGGPKAVVPQKENAMAVSTNHGVVPTPDDHDIESLFRSPVARPSTPPLKSKNPNPGPFKTPTRPTPSNRPITRSISRSIQSSKRSLKSPGLAALQRTPTRTPRSALRVPLTESPTLRRSPRFQHDEDNHLLETPMTRSISQLLSEAQDFDVGTDFDIDLGHFTGFNDDNQNMLDLGNLLDTDAALPRSSPRRRDQEPLVYDEAIWNQWSEAGSQEPEKKD